MGTPLTLASQVNLAIVPILGRALKTMHQQDSQKSFSQRMRLLGPTLSDALRLWDNVPLALDGNWLMILT